MIQTVDLNIDFEKITGIEAEHIKDFAIFAILPYIPEDVINILNLEEDFVAKTGLNLYDVLDKLSNYPDLLKRKRDGNNSVYLMDPALSKFLLSKMDRDQFSQSMKDLYNRFLSLNDSDEILVTPLLAKRITTITQFLSFIYFMNMQSGSRTNEMEVDFAHTQFSNEMRRVEWAGTIFAQQSVDKYFNDMEVD